MIVFFLKHIAKLIKICQIAKSFINKFKIINSFYSLFNRFL
uniref:Uncharacterized protein n=1 Tax=Siphoviridae sp. ctKwY15 TaxID=2827843 RepID=A0A8S5SUL0_9CAUD|nr:MAG TPA: hypothetical protein [Siphoviridae sp. ctKwY15]